VYRKVFDTKLISTSTQQQRFQILSTNNKKSPDLCGYALRKVKVTQNNLKALEIINPTEPNRPELTLNIASIKIDIPKETMDSMRV